MKRVFHFADEEVTKLVFDDLIKKGELSKYDRYTLSASVTAAGKDRFTYIVEVEEKE